MMTRRIVAAAVLAMSVAVPASAASYRTQNFVVQAPNEQLAREFGQLAEHFRKEKAIEWLGREMPAWPKPCPLKVTVTSRGAGGATQFTFGNTIEQSMHIEGSLDRLRDSVLPHEVTHTVFAHHFRRPVPRWADEGGSVLSEDDLERRRHDRMCRQLLNAGRGMPLRRLFGLTEYPRDVMVLYAQGYSVSQYLIDRGGRARFLNFVGAGMAYGWERAVQEHYNYHSVADLEKEWLEYLRTEDSLTAYRSKDEVDADQPNRSGTTEVVIRDFAPPGQPNLAPPIVARGSAPDDDEMTEWNSSPVRLSQPTAEAPMPVQRQNPNRRPPVILLPPEPIDFP